VAVDGLQRSRPRDLNQNVRTDADNTGGPAKTQEPPKTRPPNYGHTGQSTFDATMRPDRSRLSGIGPTPPAAPTTRPQGVKLDGSVDDVVAAVKDPKSRTTGGIETAFDIPGTRVVAVGGNPELMSTQQDRSGELLAALDKIEGPKPTVAMEMVPTSAQGAITAWRDARQAYEAAQKAGSPDAEDLRVKAETARKDLERQISEFQMTPKEGETPQEHEQRQAAADKLASSLTDLIGKVQDKGSDVLAIEPGKILSREGLHDTDAAMAKTISEHLDQNPDSRVLLWIGQGHTVRTTDADRQQYGADVVERLDEMGAKSKTPYRTTVVGFAGADTLPTAEKAAADYERETGKPLDPLAEDPAAKLSKAVSLIPELKGTRFQVRVAPGTGPRSADIYIHLPQ
jgi:hypothetical protein